MTLMPLFSNFFGKRKLKSPIDLSAIGVDMHSHILPGIDDGAEDLEASVEMVRQLTQWGYRKLITTPHIMSDNYRNTPETIMKAHDELSSELKKEGLNTEIAVAAEYLIDDGLMEHFEKYNALTLNENYLLLELPYFTEPPNLFEVIFELTVKGYKIVLAHPERYVYWYDKFSRFDELKDRNVLFQVNILTFADVYMFPTRKIAEDLINKGMVDFLGSDIHNPRQFGLFEKALYEPVLSRLIESGSLKNNVL